MSEKVYILLHSYQLFEKVKWEHQVTFRCQLFWKHLNSGWHKYFDFKTPELQDDHLTGSALPAAGKASTTESMVIAGCCKRSTTWMKKTRALGR